MVSSASPAPLSAGVVYSKIGTASLSSLEHSSDKLGYSGQPQDVRKNRFTAFCAGYGGPAVACALAALGVCLVVLLFLQVHERNKKAGSPHESGQQASPILMPPAMTPMPSVDGPVTSPSLPLQALSLASLCNSTEQSQLCLKTVSAFQSTQSTVALQDLTAYVAGRALAYVNQTYVLAVNSSGGGSSDDEKAALQDCLELLDLARDGLTNSINRLLHLDPHQDSKVVKSQVMDVQVWMSSSYSDQDTCWDEFQDVEGPVKVLLLKSGQPIAPLIAMALSFAKLLQEVGLSTLYALHPSPP